MLRTLFELIEGNIDISSTLFYTKFAGKLNRTQYAKSLYFKIGHSKFEYLSQFFFLSFKNLKLFEC